MIRPEFKSGETFNLDNKQRRNFKISSFFQPLTQYWLMDEQLQINIKLNMGVKLQINNNNLLFMIL